MDLGHVTQCQRNLIFENQGFLESPHSDHPLKCYWYDPLPHPSGYHCVHVRCHPVRVVNLKKAKLTQNWSLISCKLWELSTRFCTVKIQMLDQWVLSNGAIGLSSQFQPLSSVWTCWLQSSVTSTIRSRLLKNPLTSDKSLIWLLRSLSCTRPSVDKPGSAASLLSQIVKKSIFTSSSMLLMLQRVEKVLGAERSKFWPTSKKQSLPKSPRLD